MLELLRLNRLQRKVLLVILVIVVVPMLGAGLLSASWVSRNFEQSLEGWIKEAAQVDEYWLETLQRNGMLLGDALAGSVCDGRAGPSLPPQLALLAKELGINLIQLYTRDHTLAYSSVPVTMRTLWKPGQRQAVLKVAQEDKNLLAAVAITVLSCADQNRHYLVLGTLLDRAFIDRLSQMTGLKARLFYPEGNDYAKAFSEDGRPLTFRIPPAAFQQLQMKQAYYSEQAENGTYRGLYMPIVDSTGRVEAILFSGLAHEGFDEALTDQATMSFAIVALGLLIGALTGFMLSRFVVRPVEYLRNGVLKVAAQDFRAEVPITSNDELGDLARAFNAMAASLREARDEQRREFRKDKLTALGELSTALAHEIRNPIGVINTAASMLEKVGIDPARQADLIRMIHDESARLNHLLKDFQQLARHRRPEFALIDPVLPLERALRVALVAREDIRVVRRFGHGDARISADVELLQQAWFNLLVNALQAIGEQPGELNLTSYTEAGHAVLVLEDSGSGIPVEIVPRLFEPFFSTKKSGTGLGLTLANTLVEANGGWLELLRSQGKGARFAMRFPVAATEDA